MMATVAKMLLKKIAVTISFDKNKRNRLLLVLGSIVAGLFLLFLMPIMVLASMGDIELPEVDVDYDEATFMSQLSIEQQENIAAVEADGQAIADAMAARGLQEQTIKAQLIYMSYFDGNRLNDFTPYVEHFAQDDEQLISSINADYSLDIDYDEFMRTYILVMNSTINEYMFTESGSKNSADLAAWCRNAYVSGWGYADNSFGERTGDERIRCADNVGLIMGYVRYDIENKTFTDDIVDMYYTEQGGIDTMPDIQGMGVFNGTGFGVYVGGGQVVFSSAIGGCVQQQALEYGNWTSWCTFDAVSYPQEVWDRVNELRSEEENEGE
jgi:hypothetical protein